MILSIQLLVLTNLQEAHAVALSGTVLGPAITDQYFGLKVQDNVRTSTTIGTLDISGTAGCGSKCVATTGLGVSPFVDLYASQVYDPYAGGGFARIVLQYFVQYNNAPGTYSVQLQAFDILDISAGSYGQTNLAFGRAFDSSSYSFASLDLNATHCVNACSGNIGTGVDGGPIGNSTISMVANAPYLVRLIAVISPNDDGSISRAMIDPSFSTTATGGSFAYSQGVLETDVPEPSSWPVLIAGLGIVGVYRTLTTRGVR